MATRVVYMNRNQVINNNKSSICPHVKRSARKTATSGFPLLFLINVWDLTSYRKVVCVFVTKRNAAHDIRFRLNFEINLIDQKNDRKPGFWILSKHNDDFPSTNSLSCLQFHANKLCVCWEEVVKKWSLSKHFKFKFI